MADADYITLEFDNGEAEEFEILGIFDVEDKEYMALVPQDDTGDVYIYRYKLINDEDYELIDIKEEEEEFESAVRAFEEIMQAGD